MELVKLQLLNSIVPSFILFLLAVVPSLPAASHESAGFTDKYVAKSYFKEHLSLLDSSFVKSIESNMSNDLCEVFGKGRCIAPTIQCLRRDLVGEGSHRSLSYSIQLKLQPSLLSLLSSHSCQVIIIERLPLGVFADPFELHHLLQRGAFADAAVFGDTNLELPSFLSNRTVVEVHIAIASESLSTSENYLKFSLGIPLHARYPPLGQYFSRIVFREPDLLICCSKEGATLHKECVFVPSSSNRLSEKLSGFLEWEIPCGVKEHASVVSIVTFGCAIVAALVIAGTALIDSESRISEKLKRS